MSGPFRKTEEMPEQRVERDEQVTLAHTEQPSKQPFPDLGQMTPSQWFSLAAWIVGALVIIACFVRFTPFSKGVSDLFTTLANIAKGKDKKDSGKTKS